MSLNLDKSHWNRVAFGDVVRNVNDYFDADRDGVLPYVAGPNINPGEPSVASYGATDDDEFPPTFKRMFRSGDVLLHSRGIDKLAAADRSGVTGEKLFVLRSVDETVLLQEYLIWLLLSPQAQAHMKDNLTGSVNKFLNWKPLAALEIDIPPLDEQKRIADLLWAIERHKRTLADEVESVQGVLARVAATRLSALPTTARLGDLTTTRSGPSFPASDVHGESVEGSVPVIGIPNTKPDGTIDLEGVGHVTGLPASVSTIDESSLILIRTNGNRQRIGNVYIPPEAAHGHAVSAFQFLMRANDMSDRDYLFWVLSEAGMQHRMSDAASGTVGLGNLAVRWLNELEIPWTELPEERRAFVETLGTLRDGLARLRAEVAAVTAVGKVVLGEMLGGS
ncbi:restriction endonuclease subunit S [Brevibacterium ihuae]|uniref:restriction endonuclease subunit S n=1 Tax=Brevibacterium ihuae TaxID=1631743 RepID=UPI000C77A4AB|nr:restriction endonuclease subunit S [Brevibacterium ihuae]